MGAVVPFAAGWRAERDAAKRRAISHRLALDGSHLSGGDAAHPNSPDQTGVAEHDVAGLFAYARTSRKELTRVAASMTPADAERVIEFKLRDQAYSFSARKLAFHILFHEIRHWAQIATAVRNAGLEPPGFHDFLFCAAVK